MPDMETAGDGPLTVTIAGREVKLGELGFNDRRALLKSHRKGERDKLKELLTETGMVSEQQFVELRAFDKETVGAKVWSDYFFSSDGQAAILAASINKLQQGQGDSLVAQLDWDDEKILKTCAALCNVTLVPLVPPGGAKPNPPAAPTTTGYGQ